MSTKTPSTTPHASYHPRLEEIEGWTQQLDALHASIALTPPRLGPRRAQPRPPSPTRSTGPAGAL